MTRRVLASMIALACASAVSAEPPPVVGLRTVYRVDLRTDLATSASNLLGPDGARGAKSADFSLASRIRGSLSAVVVAATAEQVTLALRLEDADVSVASNGLPDLALAAAVRAALERTSLAALDSTNRIVRVWVDPASDAVSGGFVRTLLAVTQAVLPPEGVRALRRWEAEEEDPSGRYLARYELLGPSERGGTVRFRKTKLRYLAEARPRSGRAKAVVPTIRPAGALEGRLDANDGALRSVRGDESQRVLVNGHAIGTLRQRLTLERTAAEPAATDELARATRDGEVLLRASPGTTLYAQPPAEARDAARHQNQLGDATADQLLGALVAAEAGGREAQRAARPDLFLKLRSLAYLVPEACPRLGALLAAARPGSLTLEIVPLALREAGTDAAQAALVQAMRAPGADRAVVNAVVVALAGIARLGAAGEAALSEVAFGGDDRELAGVARLALGAQARELAAFAPERGERLVRRLLDALDGASDPRDEQVLVLALGNAGSTLAFPALRARAAAAEPARRAAALFAMRFIDSAEADAALIGALESDPDTGVRTRVAGAFADRQLTPSDVRAHRTVLDSQAPDGLRIAVLENLWRARDEVAEARKLVARATKDRAEAVRERAKQLLSEDRGSK